MKEVVINKGSFYAAGILLHRYNPRPFALMENARTPGEIARVLLEDVKKDEYLAKAIARFRAEEGGNNETANLASAGYQIIVFNFGSRVEIECSIQPHILLLGTEDFESKYEVVNHEG